MTPAEVRAIMARVDAALDAWGVWASDTLRPGVVYYDPEGDPTPPALRPIPKRPSPYVHTPAVGKCQCGSGSDDLGPGHSSWCPRFVGDVA